MMQLFDHAMTSIFDSKEQRKRAGEMNEKYELALREAFGSDILRMSYVRVLATSPQKQGRGYGSALMAAVNTKADSLGCASWLLSSNVANTAFYESCGFVGVKEIMIGDDNPTWTQPPFPILIMVRPTHSQLSFDASKEKLSMTMLEHSPGL
ncbi:hypothetical protein DAEQUDRAFT_504632 [Daedalea quercina L-15889]|uniref:N-acetyltransferase domain-containing protein n=1 Tax=Daedalea quercina L-15889 TaxID=1314783 RepID=A0A165T7Z4_9APHY|nr:hypothetical protein DAEQUDRAFT_504632 [Daedalea quercina L-15889]